MRTATAQSDAALVRPVAAAMAERRWPMVLPFHYGKVTVAEFTEVHLCLTVGLQGRNTAKGYAAEVAAPKWFEKSADIGIAESVERLRLAARRAVEAALSTTLESHSIAEFSLLLSQTLDEDPALLGAGLTGLERAFGVALVERALIDAVCRAGRMPFEIAVAADVLGAGRLAGPEYPAWLAQRGAPPAAISIRHTVGLDDPLPAEGLRHGRPVSLSDTIAAHGVTSFKIKLNDTVEAIDRLEEIAAILDRLLPRYRVTLDANEAFLTGRSFGDALERLAARPGLSRFMESVAYVEQPLHRSVAGQTDLRELAIAWPVIIDESDDDEDAFVRARALGYAGVSAKTCKGVLRGLRNAARATAPGGFVSAEDLCVQPGINLQHNLALAAALRVPDCERNGHHFGPGPSHLPESERAALAALHPDLYSIAELRIDRGRLDLGTTITAAGFGTTLTPEPTWTRRSAD